MHTKYLALSSKNVFFKSARTPIADAEVGQEKCLKLEPALRTEMGELLVYARRFGMAF